MGGIGSGLKHGGQVTSDFQTVDVRGLQRRGFLDPGTLIGARPLRKTGRLPPMQLQTTADDITLTIRKTSEFGMMRQVSTRIVLERTPCNYGGDRTWFVCPCCARRAAILYLGNTQRFACRQCRKLAYRSQRETECKRALRNVNKIRDKLGWLPGYIRGHGEKPKGMHWKTYSRLVEQHERYLCLALTRFTTQFNVFGV